VTAGRAEIGREGTQEPQKLNRHDAKAAKVVQCGRRYHAATADGFNIELSTLNTQRPTLNFLIGREGTQGSQRVNQWCRKLTTER